jgi:hypothetical protein
MSESPEKPRSEWRSPQVMAPIIGAVCTVLVAIIGLISSQTRASQVPVATIVVTVAVTQSAAEAALTLAPTSAATPASTQAAPATAASGASSPNVTLFYDEDSFTVWNNTDSTISLHDVSFRSGGEPWDMSIWGSMADSLPAQKCLRLVDVNTEEPDPPEPCSTPESLHGFFKVGSGEVYWREISEFEVVNDDDETVIATCPMAAGTCPFYAEQ